MSRTSGHESLGTQSDNHPAANFKVVWQKESGKKGDEKGDRSVRKSERKSDQNRKKVIELLLAYSFCGTLS